MKKYAVRYIHGFGLELNDFESVNSAVDAALDLKQEGASDINVYKYENNLDGKPYEYNYLFSLDEWLYHTSLF